MKLTLFDLDNTLLSGDSDYAWAQFLIEQGVLDRDIYEKANDAFYASYKAGTLNIHEFLAFQLRPLSQYSREQLDAWHAQFMDGKIRPMITTAARKLVDDHLDAGDVCVIITATNSFVTTPIARELKIPHLIATEPEIRNGAFTGGTFGTPCFREGKIERLDAWLRDYGTPLSKFEASRFYSDSLNDLPLLERVTHPVAVDPDDTLRRVAEERGWPTLSLR
ncbi:MAG TPA: HAD family hydrolase [Burkholderiales bacterium]|nr:HAD family hydrolase [Burkholderiales bacterium]